MRKIQIKVLFLILFTSVANAQKEIEKIDFNFKGGTVKELVSELRTSLKASKIQVLEKCYSDEVDIGEAQLKGTPLEFTIKMINEATGYEVLCLSHQKDVIVVNPKPLHDDEVCRRVFVVSEELLKGANEKQFQERLVNSGINFREDDFQVQKITVTEKGLYNVKVINLYKEITLIESVLELEERKIKRELIKSKENGS